MDIARANLDQDKDTSSYLYPIPAENGEPKDAIKQEGEHFPEVADPYLPDMKHLSINVRYWNLQKDGVDRPLGRAASHSPRWPVAAWNKLMHILNGNGGPSCSSTWPWIGDDDSDEGDFIPYSPMPLQVVPWGVGRKVEWQPPWDPLRLAQDWPVIIKANLCGELMEIHTTQHMTIGGLLDKAADSLMVHQKDLVAIEAGDILPRAMTVEQLEWLDIDFSLEAGGRGSGTTTRRSRSRTPARVLQQVPREVATIRPDPQATVDTAERNSLLDCSPHIAKRPQVLPALPPTLG